MLISYALLDLMDHRQTDSLRYLCYVIVLVVYHYITQLFVYSFVFLQLGICHLLLL